ncbi:nucleoside diphosphate kinase regulator [Enterovirga aerilata]|uniref:Nucleoside diphosphate kinase regulator n=1 Tax=Enterovirga aerilata TaxID=2730920 RepID=A0A849I1M0_9HYPH|nr:nucleoside diphosphate kinase regulator [Enterovirga sp. DB1703]NNM71494.1 nucleoside diphosphate kinase regulator [Enterovirga sp. DB1703]
MSRHHTARKPRITLSAQDYEALSRLVSSAEHTMPDVAAFLQGELDRAHVLPRGRRAPGHVAMGSRLSYRDETTGRVQHVTLVHPPEADISQGRVSVLTPIGAALIGLKAGDGIDWTTRSGDVRHLTVLEVEDETASPAAPETALPA